MKTAILFYTFGGATRKEAQRLASELPEAKLIEIEEARNRSFLGAFCPGIFQAGGRKATKIRSSGICLDGYDRIIVGAPIWAGHPAPAWNSMIKLIPAGKEVELFFCSAGGEEPQSEKGNKKAISDIGCKLVSYRDVKTGANPAKEPK